MKQDKLIIRKVQKKDINTIVDLHKEVVNTTNSTLYPELVIKEWTDDINIDNVTSQLKVKTTSWYLMELNNETIGFCQFPIARKEIYQLNIKPKFQGLGYGKLLYTFMEIKFREANTDKIELFSTLNAKNFYEKLGFEILEPIKIKLTSTEMEMFRMIKSLKK
jgi:putative acetyltransferase